MLVFGIVQWSSGSQILPFLPGRLPDAGVPPLLDRGGSQRHHGVQPGPRKVPPEDPATAEEPGHGSVSPLLRLRPPPGQPLNTHTHTPLSLPLTPSLTLRGLPPGCLAGWLKIRKPLSAGRIWGDSLPLPSQPTSSQLTSCRVTAKSSLHTHVHTHTHTHIRTHTHTHTASTPSLQR